MAAYDIAIFPQFFRNFPQFSAIFPQFFRNFSQLDSTPLDRNFSPPLHSGGCGDLRGEGGCRTEWLLRSRRPDTWVVWQISLV